MNTLIGELKNVLTGGTVIGPIGHPSQYRDQDSKRGDPDRVMGRGDLMEFSRCPERWVKGYESEETKATEWGDLVDVLFLTPDQFKSRYAVQPATYLTDGMECPICKSITTSISCKKCKTQRVPIRIEKDWNSNADECSNWESGQVGKTIVKHKLFGPACDAVRVLNEYPGLKELKEGSECQVMATASYQDEETGIVVPLKILIDLLPDKTSPWGKWIIDLKTTDSAAMRPWRSKVFKFNYDAQAAFYLDVWEAATGEDRQDFKHIVQESYSPYQTQLRLVSAEFLEIGRMKYQKALEFYCACLSSGVWPGYDCECRTIDGWQLTEPEPWMVQ
jgi:hypothetical protein